MKRLSSVAFFILILTQVFLKESEKNLIDARNARQGLGGFQMFIQGDLQAVFDALYNMGVIDPVLKLDWAKITDEMLQDPKTVQQVFREVNACAGDKSLLQEKLENMDQKSIYYLAMEVAREFCEFQDRSTLH